MKSEAILERAVEVSSITAAFCMMVLASAPAAAQTTDTFRQWLADSKLNLDFRYRFEGVEQDNALRDAAASTLRSRFTLETPALHGFSMLAEVDNVLALGDKYDSFIIGDYRGARSVVPDPSGTELNQAWVRRQFSDRTTVTLGRQRLNHGTQRFLGSVAWRQNEQTYDSLNYRFNSDGFSVDYSYLWNVNRIFGGSGHSIQQKNYRGDSHALLVAATRPWGSLSGFVYALDFRNGPRDSSFTSGLTYTGKVAALNLSATYASQTDHGDNPNRYRADYHAMEASLPAGPVTLLAGFESLGSDGGRVAFATPLSTLHKFQGFADMFLATPVNGVEDVYLGAATAVDKFKVALTWHDFSAARGSADHGREWNLSGSYQFNSHFNFEYRLASYRTRGHGVDTDKLWLGFNLVF